jgi:hypothetical protein
MEFNIQRQGRKWNRTEVEQKYHRRGIASMLYDSIQQVLGTTLYPSGWLSDDAFRFWERRGSKVLQYYRQMDHLGGLWISPKALLTLKGIAEAKLGEAEDTNPQQVGLARPSTQHQ